ncbi:Uncharacterised protein [Mycobacteroides abscessus subsp. abscessus]|nr:Uncharacterised protein [Mycobacteroides abscessus subsp. abscessus]
MNEFNSDEPLLPPLLPDDPPDPADDDIGGIELVDCCGDNGLSATFEVFADSWILGSAMVFASLEKVWVLPWSLGILSDAAPSEPLNVSYLTPVPAAVPTPSWGVLLGGFGVLGVPGLIGAGLYGCCHAVTAAANPVTSAAAAESSRSTCDLAAPMMLAMV